MEISQTAVVLGNAKKYTVSGPVRRGRPEGVPL